MSALAAVERYALDLGKHAFAIAAEDRSILAPAVKHATGLLSLTAILLCNAPGSATAQSVTTLAAEKGFTLPPDVSTPIVLRSAPVSTGSGAPNPFGRTHSDASPLT